MNKDKLRKKHEVLPDDWLEEDQQRLDEHGGMDDVQSLDVLLVPGKTHRHEEVTVKLHRGHREAS